MCTRAFLAVLGFVGLLSMMHSVFSIKRPYACILHEVSIEKLLSRDGDLPTATVWRTIA